ncbi:hypothetical protein Nizo2259_3162 [Lactiplantibacillus plantarum]|nr:hypothetical protein FBR6_0675 [Lactiplantibacillus plantarum]KZT93325.1 hypothetical protein Nizo2259_3162 [Lactiplantibacillus plantarum]
MGLTKATVEPETHTQGPTDALLNHHWSSSYPKPSGMG